LSGSALIPKKLCQPEQGIRFPEYFLTINAMLPLSAFQFRALYGRVLRGFIFVGFTWMLLGCAADSGSLHVKRSPRARPGGADARGIFLDKSGDSPFGSSAHQRFCAGLEQELAARGFRVEAKDRAGWRIQCTWDDLEWRRVNQMARVPMSRAWYLGSVYDPQGEVFSLEGRFGKYRLERGVLRVAGWRSGVLPGAEPDWLISLSQRGGGVSKKLMARLADAVADALEQR
jgi:hypothetical protein